jgi:hypothetical protein
MSVDQSALTGQSKKVDRVPGDILSSGGIARRGEGTGVDLEVEAEADCRVRAFDSLLRETVGSVVTAAPVRVAKRRWHRSVRPRQALRRARSCAATSDNFGHAFPGAGRWCQCNILDLLATSGRQRELCVLRREQFATR